MPRVTSCLLFVPDKMPRMDAAVPMDAKNAPTGTWKTAENTVSHSAHTHRRHWTEDSEERLTHEIPDSPPESRRLVTAGQFQSQEPTTNHQPPTTNHQPPTTN